MKRIVSLALVALLLAACAACAPQKDDGNRTGVGVVVSTSSSASAGEKDGNAQADVTVVAVLLDGEGVIRKCVLDHAQSRMGFDAAGQVLVEEGTPYASKLELGEAYDMKKASAIGKEWDEQARAFAAYCQGKTLAQVKGMALTQEGRPADADLAASVTVSVGGYISALEKAVQNALLIGPGAKDALGLALTTSVEKAVSAAEGENGLLQATTAIAAVTIGADGKITSSVIDEVQVPIAFDAQGQLAAGEEPIRTKLELWDEYGMKGASPIGKEWHEQVAAFCTYIVGKTPAEVGGIALNEAGKVQQADLSASVTLYAGNFVQGVEKAAANAK